MGYIRQRFNPGPPESVCHYSSTLNLEHSTRIALFHTKDSKARRRHTGANASHPSRQPALSLPSHLYDSLHCRHGLRLYPCDPAAGRSNFMQERVLPAPPSSRKTASSTVTASSQYTERTNMCAGFFLPRCPCAACAWRLSFIRATARGSSRPNLRSFHFRTILFSNSYLLLS